MCKQLKLSAIFSEGCVLQQAEQTRVWGRAAKGEVVYVEIGEQLKRTKAGSDGKFEVLLTNLLVGGPYKMKVYTNKECIIIPEIFVGEVFVCAGQSNMELPMSRVKERFLEEFENASDTQFHLYKVKEHYEFERMLEDNVQAEWITCTAERLEEISAVSYFLGKLLREAKNIPVGIINLSLGGTPIEAWMSEEGLASWPELLDEREKYKNKVYCEKILEEQEEAERKWQEEIQLKEKEYEALPYTSKEWKTIRLPGYFYEDGLEEFCGCIYLRKTFELSEEIARKPGVLHFGTLTDSDQIYINGTLIGETGYRYPPRHYPVNCGVLRAGENEIIIRLVCREKNARVTPGKKHEIEIEGSSNKITLDGEWKYQIRARCAKAPEKIFINRNATGLFQGMVAPCLPYSVRGIVWYQGESNDTSPDSYARLLKAMIMDWRRKWKQEKLPFIIVQLPSCGVDIAGDASWPKLREAQRSASELPDTAVTVNLELGEYNDLHPLDKKSIAYRIFLAIQGMVYGENVVWEGPKVNKWIVLENKVRLEFDTKDGKKLRTIDGEIPMEFELASENQIFYDAQAEIVEKSVIIYSKTVTKPAYVRYAWKDVPCRGLICNEAGLSAGPFSMKLM